MSGNNYKLEKIKLGSLTVGTPTPYKISDSTGEELLPKGGLIESEIFKKILEQVGHFVKKVNIKPAPFIETDESNHTPKLGIEPTKYKGNVNPFAELDDLCWQLQAIFAELEDKAEQPKRLIEKRIYELAANIQGLIIYDADALMGAVHLSDRFSYEVRHPMQIAILTEVILDRLQLPQTVRLSTLAAALTSNVSLNPYQEILNNPLHPLSKSQNKLINKHPLISAHQLRKAGVKDKLWLELVEQHHEKLDGSGYPKQLKGTEIKSEALVLALADEYSDMITPRFYNGPIRLAESLRDLFMQRGSKYDDILTKIFIHEVGLYPPGVYVHLDNGDLAVVVGRTEDFKYPLVASIKKPDGNMYSQIMHHNTSLQGYKIKHVCDPTGKVRVDPSQLWGFEAIKVDLSSVDSFIRDLIFL